LSRLVAACFPLLPLRTTAPAQRPASRGGLFRLNGQLVAREVTLTDLGFTGPPVLGSPGHHPLYLPVPANVPLNGGINQRELSALTVAGPPCLVLDNHPVVTAP
jgi:hypothetical protein